MAPPTVWNKWTADWWKQSCVNDLIQNSIILNNFMIEEAARKRRRRQSIIMWLVASVLIVNDHTANYSLLGPLHFLNEKQKTDEKVNWSKISKTGESVLAGDWRLLWVIMWRHLVVTDGSVNMTQLLQNWNLFRFFGVIYGKPPMWMQNINVD